MVNLLAMPTYEYRCNACAHEFEEFQSIKADRLEKCPACGKLTLERLISGGAFQLKGGGWYSDLYSSPKPGAGTRTEKDRTDSLQKAVDKDSKKKADAA
jgi:putative FmdB family regulatory protein